MKKASWIVNIIIGIFIVGALIIGLAIASLFIIPMVAALIIALLIYYWLKNKPQRENRSRREEKEKILNGSSYTVLDEKDKFPDED